MVANHKFFIFAFRTENVQSQQINTTMKKLLALYAFALVTFMVNAQSCPDDNHPHAIDLGLPSGTKWACCNVGAATPEENGGYYAWGEIKEKSVYNEENYDYFDNLKGKYIYIGNTISGTNYDVAYVKWNEPWRMPNDMQLEELVSYCVKKWEMKNGIYGFKFIGPNGKYIFLPNGGYKRWYEYVEHFFSQYWSGANACYPTILVIENIDEGENTAPPNVKIGNTICYEGCMVRPVVGTYPYPLELSSNSLELKYRKEGIIDIISGNGNYMVESSNPNVACAYIDSLCYYNSDQNSQFEGFPNEAYRVIISGRGVGESTLTVTDKESGQSVKIEVKVDYSNLELSKSILKLHYGDHTIVDIYSGNGSYSIENNNPNVVNAVLDSSSVKIDVIGVGEAIITVNDIETGLKKNINVISTYAPLDLVDQMIVLTKTNHLNVTIYSGNGNYSIENSNPDVAIAIVESESINIIAGNEGRDTITVIDNHSGETAPIYVEVINSTCPDDNHPHAIDLGLPSGTLWACCNVGTTKPEEYGGYYAWGEIEEKNIYYADNYSHYDIATQNVFNDLDECISGTQYDVAHMKWGGTWQMPSWEQVEDVVYYNTVWWVNINGIRGVKIMGSNGNFIFMPASGLRHLRDYFYKLNAEGSYWSGTQSTNDILIPSFYFAKNGMCINPMGREAGLSVRPIINSNDIVANITYFSAERPSQTIYNIYGIKVADKAADMNTLPPGIYIVNGKKMVIK